MWRFMNAANAVTLLGLLAALAAALLALHGRLAYGLAAMLLSGLCDTFDGVVARLLERDADQRTFGARLDSLVDACSFGVAPVFLLHGAGLTSPGELALLGAFACAAAWRLAYFDTLGMIEEGARRYFIGVPTTFVALGVPLAGLAGFHGARSLRIAAAVAAGALAVGMVAPIRFPKPRPALYAPLSGIGVALVVLYLAAAGRYLPE